MTIDPLLATIIVVALILGILIGIAMRAPLKRRAAVLGERVAGLERERDATTADRDRLALEIKAREAQIRPLSDEVDKLRRDFAKLRNSGDPAAQLNTGLAADTRGVDPLNLDQLKGVGPKFADKLRAAGITRIDQISGWTSADIEVIDGQMGDFRGRIAGDRLVEQAKLLTEGRYTEYETLFGKLG
jgi:predicted flap endonuclease-1-like 5' DNA nuclease